MTESAQIPTAENSINPSSRRRFGIGFIELIVLVLTAVGGYLAFKTQSLASQYRTKRLELEAEIGDMPIADPSKYYVQLLKSNDPLELRWRVYVPETNDFCEFCSGRDPTGGSFRSGGGGRKQSGEGIFAIRLNPEANNKTIAINAKMKIGRSSSSQSSSMRNATIYSQLLSKDFSTWEIAGQNGIESFDADQFHWLWRVKSDYDSTAQQWRGFLGYGIGSHQAYNEIQNEQ